MHTYPRDRCLGVFGHAPTINGWVEYGDVGTYPTPATYMRGYWSVPAAPSNYGGRGSGQLNYLFNSIQGHDAVPPNTQWIAQPVLTYGCYNNGWFGCNVGGGFWWIASWLVWANGYVYMSSALQVSVGNQIAGQVSWYANSNCSVGYAYYIKAINQTPNPPIVKELAYCPSTSSPQGFSLEAGVLEVRGITSCNQLPNQTSITFGPVYTTPSQSAWPTYFGAGAYQSPTCSWGHSSTSDSVTLYWRP